MLHTQTSRRRRLTFCDAFIGFPAKWLLRNERRNSILMTCHYSDLASASDWLRQLYLGAQYHQIGVMTLHQRGISALDPQAAFREGTSIGRAKMSAVLFRLHENECRNFEVLLTSQSLNFFFFALLPTRLITGTSFGISELCKLQKVFWLHFLSLF